MRVLLSTYGSRGDVEPMVGLAVHLRALGAEMPVCAPPDFAKLLARVGVPPVPVGQPVRPMHRCVAELVAAQFDTVPAVAEGCEALVATGVMPASVWL
jgi:vancomycin aglycone glucosyltransferase